MLQVLLTWIPERTSQRMGSDLIRRKRKKDVTGKKLPMFILSTEFANNNYEKRSSNKIYMCADQCTCISDLQTRTDCTLNKSYAHLSATSKIIILQNAIQGTQWYDFKALQLVELEAASSSENLQVITH